MDPVTATVTFVGLSASLITLVTAVGETSKAFFELQRKFKDAPKSTVRLQQDLQNLQLLLVAIKSQSLEYEGSDVPQALQDLWNSFIVQLEGDICDFKTKISTFNISRQGLKARICHVFAESTVNEFHKRYSAHIQNLMMVQTLMNEQRLTLVTANNMRVLNETRALSQAISPRTMSLGFRHHTGLRSQQRIFFRSDPGLESWYDRVGIVAARTSRASATLNQDAFGPGIPITTVEESYKNTKVYVLPTGKLFVHYTRSRLRHTSPEGDEWGVTRVDTVFIPPWFLSNTMIRAHIECSRLSTYGQPWPTYRLQPISINQDPELLKALYKCDVPQLRNLFSTNRARPTDMIIEHRTGDAITLLEATLRMFLFIIPCSQRRLQHRILLDFLLDRALFPSSQALIVFFESMKWPHLPDHQDILDGHFETYYRDIITRCESSPEEVSIPSTVFVPEGWSITEHDVCDGNIKLSILPAMVEGVLGFGVIRDILLHQPEPWTVEDLSMSSVWYIGILAYADRVFFKILQSYLRGYRSVFKTLNASVTDEILNSVFGIDIIVSQVVGAPSKERIRFLRTVVRKGTTSMLAPFIDAGINLDEGHIEDNYLGNAAVLAKLDSVNMLVDAGADSARAIPVLCRHACKLETSVFNSLFSTLLDRSTAGHGNVFDISDALQEVLKSDRAIDIRPDAPFVLLKKGRFDDEKLFGSEELFVPHSYALSAIRYDRPAALKLLLEYGNPSDLVIGKMYSIDREWFRPLEHYTWLTLAVELGKTACVDVLLKHAKNPADSIIRPDGEGRSALQIAMAAAAAPHPRKTVFSPLHWSEHKAVEASALQDTAILALLRDALPVEHRNMLPSEARIGTTNLENHIRSIPSIFLLSSIAKFAFSSITKSCGYRLNSLLELLGSILDPTPNGFSQINLINACKRLPGCPRCGEKHKYVTRDAQSMWAQLGRMSVYEGLLVALGYVSMYFFIIAHFSLAFALSLTSVRSPGRSIMIGAAILALAMLWK